MSVKSRLANTVPKRLRPKTRAGRVGAVVGGVALGLVAFDLIALAATAVIAATVGLR